MRRPIIAANWKMHKTSAEALDFVEQFLPLISGRDEVDIVIAPPFTALEQVGRALAGSGVALAAQNVNSEEKGAFTGEIAAGMLKELGCVYSLVGHSERRTLYGESSQSVARKAAALLSRNILPIVCVGETLEEREAERTFEVVGEQLESSLETIPDARAAEIVLAYEPVWAIGTGKTATPELAQQVHAFIRERLAKRFGNADGERIRIQYGGSVKPDNIAQLMDQTDIDGARVGGASLEPESFSKLVRFG